MLKKLGLLMCCISMAMALNISVSEQALAQKTMAQKTMAQSKKQEPTWKVNFKDSDIQEVIKFVAEVTQKTIVIDPRVKGRVKVISNKPLNEPQLLDLFRSVLEVHDFTLIEVNDVLRIVPLKDARSSPLPVVSIPSDKEGYVTQVIQLKNIAAAKVLPVLRPLVPQHSHLAAYDPSNAIVVSDTAKNIERLQKVIEKIDTAAFPTTEIVSLKYADAQDLASTLEKLQGKSDKGASANKLQIVADTRNNALLITGEDVQRERIKKLIRRLDHSQPQSGNVRVIYLEYANAKDVAAVLSKVVQNMSKLIPGDKGKANNSATVEADEDTNSLLITATGDVLNSLLSVVERLDIRRAQVLVEAIIVEINADASESLGVEWLFSNNAKGVLGSSIRNGNTIGGVAQGVFDADATDGLQSIAASLAGTTGQVLGVAGSSGSENFLTLITAFESSSDANILSTPSLLTMDNHEASISVGQSVPFRTGSFTSTGDSSSASNPFTTIQRQDVGITLTVTPHVNEGDKVLLDIDQEVSSLSGAVEGSADLVTNQSKISTQVLSKDGEIIILGGLIKEDVQDVEQRVPLLGHIPLIGNLFKFQSTSFRRANLMVFIRAEIIRDDETLLGATAEKYRYIRDQQLGQRKKGLQMMSDDLVPVLPEMSAEKIQLLKDIYKAEPNQEASSQEYMPAEKSSADGE